MQEVLRLYNFSDSADLDKQIAGIAGVSSKRHFARINSESGIAFARGTQVHMEFDEEDYSGSGVYLFAAVIDHFLGLYASLNSFSQLVVKTRQRREVLKRMATTGGPSNPDVSVSTVEAELREEPFLFEFFQAVRLLERLFPDKSPVGRFNPPSTEVVRFVANSTLAFPASEVQSLEWPKGRSRAR